MSEPSVLSVDICPLPSRGVFYPPGHPLHMQTEIFQRDMSTREEDLLINRVLLKNNMAFDKVLQNIIQVQNLDTTTMTIADRKAAMIRARICSYGKDYDVTMTCPNCGSSHKTTVDLQAAFELGMSKVKTLEENLEFFNVSKVSHDQFAVVLPKSQWRVVFRVLNGADEIRMAKQSQAQKKALKGQDNESQVFTQLLRNLIVSIEDNTDPAFVNGHIYNMPARDAQKLREIYFYVSCNFRLLVNMECSEEGCDYEGESEIPLTADLFRFNT